jgi:hypothetical protein
MINQYNGEHSSQQFTDNSHRQKSGEDKMAQTPDYGNLGLNKVVNSLNQSATAIKAATQKLPSKIRSSLDEFLNEDDISVNYSTNTDTQDDQEFNQFVSEEQHKLVSEQVVRPNRPTTDSNMVDLQTKIMELERKLNEVSEIRIESSRESEKNLGLYQLRTTLKTLDLDESIIRTISKKAQFELNATDLMDQDVVFEYALRELHNIVTVAMPLYSKTDLQHKSVFTIVLSEVASGQTSMVYKLAATTKNSVVITFDPNKNSEELNFTSTMLGLEKKKANTLAELMTYCRQYENWHDGCLQHR